MRETGARPRGKGIWALSAKDPQIRVLSACYDCTHMRFVYSDSVLISADSNADGIGALECSNLSSISISTGSSVDVVSATLDLLCNVTGGGDLALACSTTDCEMSFGGDINRYSNTSAYHVSNTEFVQLQTSGDMVFGSQAGQNVSTMWLDGVSAAFDAKNVSFLSSSGHIRILNGSSSFSFSGISASFTMNALGNISFETNFAIDLSNGGSSIFKASGAFGRVFFHCISSTFMQCLQTLGL